MKAHSLPLSNVNLSQLQFDSISTKLRLNLISTSGSNQPQPQYQPQLNLNHNLNSIWLWHKSNPILYLFIYTDSKAKHWFSTEGATISLINICFRYLHMVLAVLSLLCLFAHSEGGRVLVWCPAASKSIKITFMPVVETLAERGHEVVLVTPFMSKDKIPGVAEIHAVSSLWKDSQGEKVEWKISWNDVSCTSRWLFT